MSHIKTGIAAAVSERSGVVPMREVCSIPAFIESCAQADSTMLPAIATGPIQA